MDERTVKQITMEGKAKELFEEWFMSKDYDYLGHGYLGLLSDTMNNLGVFASLNDSMKWGVLVDYL